MSALRRTAVGGLCDEFLTITEQIVFVFLYIFWILSDFI